jgi:hypothetical protein
MLYACAVLYCHLCCNPLYHIFLHYLTNGTIFGKKVILHKMCVLIFSITSSEMHLFLRKFQLEVINLHRSYSWQVLIKLGRLVSLFHHNNLPLISALFARNQTTTLTLFFFKIHCNIILPYMSSPSQFVDAFLWWPYYYLVRSTFYEASHSAQHTTHTPFSRHAATPPHNL